MAIVIEEARNRPSLFALVTWIAVIGGLFFAVYYFFIKNPSSIAVNIPPAFESTREISGISLDASAITNHPKFQSRRQHIPPIVPGPTGRRNPFLPSTTFIPFVPTATSTTSTLESGGEEFPQGF